MTNPACTLVLLSPATPTSPDVEHASLVLVGSVPTLLTITRDLQHGTRASLLSPSGEWVFTVGPVGHQPAHQPFDHVPNRLEA